MVHVHSHFRSHVILLALDSTAAVNTVKPRYSDSQTLASRFSLRKRSLKWHTSSTILSFLSIYNSFDPVTFSGGLGQDSIYFAAPVFRTYMNILQAPGLAAAKTIRTKKICSQDLRTAAGPIV